LNLKTRLANGAIACATYAGIAIGVVHLSNRDYDIIAEPMSYYAVGVSGSLMTTIILLFAASVIALGLVLERSVPGLSRAGIAVLKIAGASLVLAAVFPTDVTTDTLPVTVIGLIHTMASYLFSPCLVVAALLLSRRFDDVRLRHLPTFVLALASWLSLIVLTTVNLFNLQIGGIGQRVFLAATLLWLMVTAFRLRRKLTWTPQRDILES